MWVSILRMYVHRSLTHPSTVSYHTHTDPQQLAVLLNTAWPPRTPAGPLQATGRSRTPSESLITRTYYHRRRSAHSVVAMHASLSFCRRGLAHSRPDSATLPSVETS